MNARTGRLYSDFGAEGAVDLSGSGRSIQDTSLTRREANPDHVPKAKSSARTRSTTNRVALQRDTKPA